MPDKLPAARASGLSCKRGNMPLCRLLLTPSVGLSPSSNSRSCMLRQDATAEEEGWRACRNRPGSEIDELRVRFGTTVRTNIKTHTLTYIHIYMYLYMYFLKPFSGDPAKAGEIHRNSETSRFGSANFQAVAEVPILFMSWGTV